jgi:hypothetical protein
VVEDVDVAVENVEEDDVLEDGIDMALLLLGGDGRRSAKGNKKSSKSCKCWTGDH